MGKIKDAIYEIREIDEISEKDTKIHQVHPFAKFIITILYVICVVSFHKYDLVGLMPMVVYPLVLSKLSEIPIKTSLRKIKIILPLICFVGILNPVFDRTQVIQIGDFIITGGLLSMLTLFLKGIFTLMGTFLLVATTGIEGICYALRTIHIPKMIVTQILLVYRYIIVLMEEANAVSESYSLRAPNQKGVKYKVWGSLLGQLLYRSIDRAGNIYESMLLRGFQGEFYNGYQEKWKRNDFFYIILWVMIMVILKIR